MDKKIQFRIVTFSLVIVLLICALTATISREWISFSIHTNYGFPDNYEEELLDVNMGLWTLEWCNWTLAHTPMDGDNSKCSVDGIQTVLDLISVLEIEQTYKSTWTDVLSMVMGLRFIMISADVLTLLGGVSLVIYHAPTRLKKLKAYFSALWFYFAGSVMLIALACAAVIYSSLGTQLNTVLTNCQQTDGNQCLLTSFHNFPMAIVLLGISSMLSVVIALIFTVLGCRRRRQTAHANDTGLPEDLIDFGPVVSCEDDDIELQRFIHKSNS